MLSAEQSLKRCKIPQDFKLAEDVLTDFVFAAVHFFNHMSQKRISRQTHEKGKSIPNLEILLKPGVFAQHPDIDFFQFVRRSIRGNRKSGNSSQNGRQAGRDTFNRGVEPVCNPPFRSNAFHIRVKFPNRDRRNLDHQQIIINDFETGAFASAVFPQRSQGHASGFVFLPSDTKFITVIRSRIFRIKTDDFGLSRILF